MYYHHGSGLIVYDPYRGEMKRRTKQWCVIEVDKEITRYYRWWLQFEKHIRLQPPSWDAHISIVRGEFLQPDKRHLWKKYQRKEIDFLYQHGDIQCHQVQEKQHGKTISGLFYSIGVECPALDDMRSELGLCTGFKYHLTIGRTYQYEVKKK